MADEIRSEPDPQNLLPPGLRLTWAVVPRVTLYWLFVAGAIVGVGGALSVCGFALGHDRLRWGWPVGLALAWVGAKVVSRVEERRVRMLRGRPSQGIVQEGE